MPFRVWPWSGDGFTFPQLDHWTILELPSFSSKRSPTNLSKFPNPENPPPFRTRNCWGEVRCNSIDQQDWKLPDISYQPITWYDILVFAYIGQSLFLAKLPGQASRLEMGPVGGSFTWASRQDSASQGRNLPAPQSAGQIHTGDKVKRLTHNGSQLQAQKIFLFWWAAVQYSPTLGSVFHWSVCLSQELRWYL